jgi:hypothetical protein
MGWPFPWRNGGRNFRAALRTLLRRFIREEDKHG